ncbi:YbaN family protein [Xinfangfangia pollutisoli]|uniref:YbaN family protein n=1 Tax=Xinfangfangia pollutisoli TaxID=2865960 RepID=UPI001CD443D4|nr:YbaN family protein [Xinfangfangia pollutisoli]
MRTFWMALGLTFLAVGLLGAVLPVLPTTPFLLVAAACFARSSPRLHRWLLDHPLFGPPIRDWEESGAIRPRAKALAVTMMAAVFLISLWAGLGTRILIAQGVLMAIGAAFVLSRPSGPPR